MLYNLNCLNKMQCMYNIFRLYNKFTEFIFYVLSRGVSSIYFRRGKKLWERQEIKIEGVEERLKGAKKCLPPLKKGCPPSRIRLPPRQKRQERGGGRTDKLGGRKPYYIQRKREKHLIIENRGTALSNPRLTVLFFVNH